jgi:quercetin dioxygenase-like cupin family protein
MSLQPRTYPKGSVLGHGSETIRPGDRIYIEPDEEHWRGATPNRLMDHLAANETDDDHVAAH